MLLIISDEQISRLVKLVGAAAMVSLLLGSVKEFDYRAYASALQKDRMEMQWDENSARSAADQLHRRYIESQCAAYILDRAMQMQIELSEVNVTVEWNTGGYWYPVHAEMTVIDENTDLSPLKRIIESELGIPIGEQTWRGDNQRHGTL